MRTMRLQIACLVTLAGCASAPEPVIAPNMTRSQRVEAVLPLVRGAAGRHKVPPELILAVIQVESSFRPDARSRVGARGLMQLMPRTAASLARRLDRPDYRIDDPRFNVDAGSYYLAYLLQLFDGDSRWALAGYNAGPTRALKWRRRDHLPRQVSNYVSTVLAARDRFSGWFEQQPAGEPGVSRAVAAESRIRQRGAQSPPVQPARGGLANGPMAPPSDSAPQTGEDTDGEATLDVAGLAQLIREKERRYGARPDEPLPDQ